MGALIYFEATLFSLTVTLMCMTSPEPASHANALHMCVLACENKTTVTMPSLTCNQAKENYRNIFCPGTTFVQIPCFVKAKQ